MPRSVMRRCSHLAILVCFVSVVSVATGNEAECCGEYMKCNNKNCILNNQHNSRGHVICIRNGVKSQFEYRNNDCHNGGCIPRSWVCDGHIDCDDGADEKECPNEIEKIPETIAAKKKLTDWFLRRRKNDTMTEKWGTQLHRIAAALYLANATIFTVDNNVGEGIASELTVQLLSKRYQKRNLRSFELALFINAFIASCINPQKFYGRNLVSDLRTQVERSSFPNPIEFLSLCNAKDRMSQKDVDRILSSCNCKGRTSCADTQALAVMALSCIRLQQNSSQLDKNIENIVVELKNQQHENGTIVDLRTTALVLQALIATDSHGPPFDVKASVKMILDQQNSDGSFKSFLDSYYILPVLNYKSLTNINNDHCIQQKEEEIESVKELLLNENSVQVQCSIYIDEEINASRSWTLKVPSNSSFYDVLEILNESLDSNYRVKYSVINEKPYISEVFHIESDTDEAAYWFAYKRTLGSNTKAQLLEASPVDVKVEANNEFILRYKTNGCQEETLATDETLWTEERLWTEKTLWPEWRPTRHFEQMRHFGQKRYI